MREKLTERFSLLIRVKDVTEVLFQRAKGLQEELCYTFVTDYNFKLLKLLREER